MHRCLKWRYWSASLYELVKRGVIKVPR